MKTYNKQIQITVELDSIAQSLHSVMNHEFKHVDSVVEAIIGRLDSTNDQLGMTVLYNALNGYNNEINFEVDDIIICSDKVYAYWSPESIINKRSEYKAIGEARVVGVDIYANDKLTIEYKEPLEDGTLKTKTIKVKHTSCSKMVQIEETLINA